MTRLEKQMVSLIKSSQERIDNMLPGYRYGMDETGLSGEDKEYLYLCRELKVLLQCIEGEDK